MASAVRRVLSKGYHAADFRADVLAGCVVGIVALPLSMALAIAVGVPPQHGLYTAIFAGALTAVLGGCKFQVTGPTAAFVVVLAPIVVQHGLAGLLCAGMLSGVLLVVAGVAGLGDLIRFIPYPVTTGFTAGIATVIGAFQLKDFFGLQVQGNASHFAERVVELWSARGSARPQEVTVAAFSLALLLGVPRLTRRIPAPLVAIVLASVGCALAAGFFPGFAVDTIGTRFHSIVDGAVVPGIPRGLPALQVPWQGLHLTLASAQALFLAAFAIAILGAIESLLSAVIADGVTGTRHDPNAELVGLGVGNLVAPLFGGIAATGALARTATNIRAGARSPLAAVTHSIVVLLAMLLLAPLISYVPMASLAALLLVVAWNMSEAGHFLRMVRIAPRSDVVVLLSCFALTVLFDMVVAVSVGVVLAALLFMRRMATLTEGGVVLDATGPEEEHGSLPQGVTLYEIQGPLFFGAAQNAMKTLSTIRTDRLKVLVLSLAKVPTMDATGLVALESAVGTLTRSHVRVLLAGPLPRPHDLLERAAMTERYSGLEIFPTQETALQRAAQLAR